LKLNSHYFRNKIVCMGQRKKTFSTFINNIIHMNADKNTDDDL